MGKRKFQEFLPDECHRRYCCVHCRAHLANHDELISKVCIPAWVCMCTCEVQHYSLESACVDHDVSCICNSYPKCSLFKAAKERHTFSTKCKQCLWCVVVHICVLCVFQCEYWLWTSRREISTNWPPCRGRHIL